MTPEEQNDKETKECPCGSLERIAEDCVIKPCKFYVLEGLKIILEHNLASTSLLCRKMNISFNKSALIMQYLENIGAVGPFKGNNNREILVKSIIEIQNLLKK